MAAWYAARPFPARGYLSPCKEQPGERAPRMVERRRAAKTGHGIQLTATARRAADQDADAVRR